MIDILENRCEQHRLFKAIDDAFRAGDFDALGQVLGGSARWFNEEMPCEFGLGHPLEYAIYWSPLAFIEQLIRAGSDVNYEDNAGFPSLIAALSTKRADKLEILELLIRHGADLHQRGINDWTPLHYAASTHNLDAIRLLVAAGADPMIRSRIDTLATPREEAEAAGYLEGASLLRRAEEQHRGNSRGR